MTRPAPIDDHQIVLADGRRLAYLELGDPEGAPVLWCHGGLSSRLDACPAAASAQAHGLRLIVPNRPGVGRSTRQVGRTMGSWAADASDLAAQLELDELAVMGWSLGGGFAQAVAAAGQPRVRHLTLVASVIPPTWPGMQGEVNTMDRLFMRLHDRGAKVDRSLIRALRVMARHAPRALARQGHFPPEQADAIVAAINEGLRFAGGAVDEYRCMSVAWGFEPEQISVPTSIWQGDADTLVPAAWGQRLADAIEGAELHLVPGAGHYLAYDHWDELFDDLAS